MYGNKFLNCYLDVSDLIMGCRFALGVAVYRGLFIPGHGSGAGVLEGKDARVAGALVCAVSDLLNLPSKLQM